MIFRYLLFSGIFICITIFSYIYNFYYLLDYKISNSPGDWSDFSSYIGGLLSPIFSFLTIILLIRSLDLQKQSNKNLEYELEAVYKTEYIRSFESQLHAMIGTQRDTFQLLELNFDEKEHLFNVEAVRKLEDRIHFLKSENKNPEEIENYLFDIDKKEHIYNILRSFSVIIKLVFDKLSDEKGFNCESRKDHIKTVINMTAFSQLRLLLICMQFIDTPHSKYLNKNKELNNTLKELGLKKSY